MDAPINKKALERLLKYQKPVAYLFSLTDANDMNKNLLKDILEELETDPNDGGQSRLPEELVERIKKVLEK